MTTKKTSACVTKFCSKTLKKARASIMKTNRKAQIGLEKKLKELKKQISIAENQNNTQEMEQLSNTHVAIYEMIQALKETNKMPLLNKIIQESCAKFYCNPGCKNTAFEKETFHNKLPSDFLKKMQKHGAISACIPKPPKEDLF